MKSFVSKPYRLIVLLYAAFPLLYPIFVALAFRVSASNLATLLLSFGFWMVSLFAGITAYGLWDTRRWAWYFFVFLNAMITYFGAVLASTYGHSEYRLDALGVQYFLQIVFLLKIRAELRVPYLIPKIRWWESNPAYKVAFHCEIHCEYQDPVKGDILDFAHSGCFVRTMGHFRQEEKVVLRAQLFGQPLSATAFVVWRAGEGVTHPKGVGLRFLSPKRPEKRLLVAVHKRFSEIHRLFASSRYLYNPDEFNQRLLAIFDKPLKFKQPKTESLESTS